VIAAERPRGVFSRQLILGDTLDTDRVQASYAAGVLTLRIPVAEKGKPARSRSPTRTRTPAAASSPGRPPRWPDTSCIAANGRVDEYQELPDAEHLEPDMVTQRNTRLIPMSDSTRPRATKQA
jgi:hypothetical protein